VYDIIIIDKVKPVMDGVRATRNLRELEHDGPAAALTANEVADQSAIFLENGLSDFVSNPVDLRHLKSLLNKLMRDKQKPGAAEGAAWAAPEADMPRAPGAGTQKEISRRFAEAFSRDANRTIAVLEDFTRKGGQYSEDEIRAHVIHTHGMKSALAYIGEKDLSEFALELELLGRKNNIEALIALTPVFLSFLKALVAELAPNEVEPCEDMPAGDVRYLADTLIRVKAACGEYDASAADEALAALNERAWPQHVKDLQGKIAGHLLHSSFFEISDEIDRWLVEFPGP